MPGFDRGFVDGRRDGIMLHPRGAKHRAADRAGRREDQSQSDNLVDKELRDASADLGAHSIGGLFDPVRALFEDSSTGTVSIPSL